jgi:hypothetical protein
MLLTQYLNHADSRLAEPHRRLMAAVLKTVVDDCRDSVGRRAIMVGELAGLRSLDEAFDYVASTDRAWPFSFENLCDALGMDPECLRRELQKEPGI